MFENLHNLLIKEYDEKKANAHYYIENGYMPTWSERVHSDRGIQRYSTESKWAAYQAGELTRKKAVEIATARAYREIEKAYRHDVEKLESAAAAPDVEGVTIRVEWKRSATWGYNPHAVVIVNAMNRYEGKASGCGYDKLTAAIGSALNQSAVIRKMLYQAKEKALQAGYNPETGKKGYICESNRECIAYGAGYGTLPYFEGGTGMSSFEAVFNACGLKMKVYDRNGKYSDYFFFEKGEQK